ncbi:MAG: PIN domain-containing protein, partial [Acidimicrobiales bacterium]
DRGLRGAVSQLRGMPPAQVFAGSVVGTTGLLLGIVAGLPLVALVHSSIDFPVAGALAWVLCAGGVRIGIAKGDEIVRAAGMAHLLQRSDSPPSSSALLVDTSALLERHLVVLGHCGLLGGGLVVPRFVLDEARALAGGPDPVSSRRARGGLEVLEALQRQGVAVQVLEDEVPELEANGDKALALAQRLRVRLATCSAELSERAEAGGVTAVNLRRLSAELTPHHPTGERLVVDLVKEGRQARQAVGYLPDGDMVVVNDASHLVGRQEVPVIVSAVHSTSQGVLLFAQLADVGSSGLSTPS